MGVSSNPIIDEPTSNIESQKSGGYLNEHLTQEALELLRKGYELKPHVNFIQIICKNCGKPVGFESYNYCSDCKCSATNLIPKGEHHFKQEHVKGSNIHCSVCIDYQAEQPHPWGGNTPVIPEEITLHNDDGSATQVNSKNLFRDKLDDYENKIDAGKQSKLKITDVPPKIRDLYCGTTGSDLQGNQVVPLHLKGDRGDCPECKKFKESKQISPETLKGGFKAASGKATFDLLPVRIFGDLLLPNVSEPYLQLTHSLLNFWEHNRREDLYLALDEAFELLTQVTESEIQSLFEIGELYAIGAKKYSNRNWEKGIDWGIVWSAAIRHLLNHIRGEERDPVDGQYHLTSVCWNIIALLHYTADPKYKEFDSRNEIIVAENKGQK